MNLYVETKEDGNTQEVKLSGEIDAYTAPKLKEALLPLIEIKGTEVVVNMEDVSYMDSTGLGVFIGALKSSDANNSKLRLICLQDRVRRLFDITGLDGIINIDSSVRGGK
ncbi:anti-sigma factor antagonist [Gracilibacillus sp. S3-1-1]|uniref:Anti-sigma factor antagonist n=1 Tax=Gracilibacillus pellucidus TaxID=3095368 RepID=A0ACC6M5T2_9BACI|nr:anti-sigma factor antagonist [Gracilibacillus sp. S3-1-1]MDX8046304.1 anti-sigma factor antagonist [Gracilibacillus sp. S3-1-1]